MRPFYLTGLLIMLSTGSFLNGHTDPVNICDGPPNKLKQESPVLNQQRAITKKHLPFPLPLQNRSDSSDSKHTAASSNFEEQVTEEWPFPWDGMKWLVKADHRPLPPRDKDTWRIDFSRFNPYKEAPPADDSGGWTWSSHGVWDSHIPECFPFITFSRDTL